MVNECVMGPINIDAAHLEDNNKFADGTESWTVLTPHRTALQLTGLAMKTNRVDYGNTSIVGTSKEGWGIVPVDTSQGLVDNEDWAHRGWYLINTTEPNVTKGLYMQTAVTAEKVANFGDYLQMNYTPGYNDGTVQEYNYPPGVEVVNTLMDKHWNVGSVASGNYEGCASWLGCDWATGGGLNFYNSNDPIGNMYATPAISKVAMSGIASGNGQPGWVTYSTNQEFSPPWTLEFDLEWNHYTTDGAGGEFMPSVFIGWHAAYRPEDWRWASYDVNGSVIRFYLFVRNNVTYAAAYINRPGRVDLNYLWAYGQGQLTVDQKKVRYKVEYLPGGVMTVWLDKDGGSNWTKMWGPAPTGFDWRNAAFGMGVETRPWTRDTNNLGLRAYNDEFKVYKTSLAYTNNNNVIPLPAGDYIEPEIAPSFVRQSEDGDIPLYTNPTGPLYFYADQDTVYEGSVKAFNTNYEDDVARIITRTDEIIDFLTFPCMYVTNGLLKLMPMDSGVQFYYWNTSIGDYVLLNTFDVGTIKTMKVIYVSPERFSFKINDTLWTVFRGKPFVRVEHPTTDISYTMGTAYYHDTITGWPAGVRTDMSMLTQNYLNVVNTSTYNLQIIKISPTTIQSDIIPADVQTGIGWFDYRITNPTNMNYPHNLAKEYLVQPITKIGVQRV